MNQHSMNQRSRRRQVRARARVKGTPDRPRLSVFRSGKHISLQLINDATHITLASVSDREILNAKKGAKNEKVMPRMERARWVGEEMAKRASEKGVTMARFDRGRYRYHGLVQAIAEAARKGGLKF